jgi:gliding motility-associated protein GldM
MALPKEPRQKMINIMYLVLTALLALNVSAEILNAFKTVERSLSITNKTVDNSTQTILASLQEKTTQSETAEKAKTWFPLAQEAAAKTKAMNDYITGLKNEILKAADFDPAKKKDSSYNEGSQDIATRIMVEQGKGKELLTKLQQYKRDMVAIMDRVNNNPLVSKETQAEVRKTIEGYLNQVDLNPPPTKNHGNNTWEAAYFRMVPTVASLTMLSKFQNDIKTTENRTVALFHEQVGKVAVRFDTYSAIVGQSSTYLMPGQDIEITAGVGAFSKAAAPRITIGGTGASIGEDGAAHLKVSGGGIGNHTIPVSIQYVDQEGKPQSITKTIEYTVGQANASIALDKMNVLYINVDNPVTIAASGGGDDKVQVSISGGGGSISKVGPGKYNVRVSSVTDDAKITVSVDGKVAGVSQFRVRTIPDPVATIGGEPSGATVNKNALAAQSAVAAWVQNFPFELKYSVTGYSIVVDTEDDPLQVDVTGNLFTPQVQAALRKARPGGLISVENIRALGPDGRTRKLPSIFYNIK